MNMLECQKVIDQTNLAAECVAETAGPIDSTTAELVLRNTAVAADRLTPSQFLQLGQPAFEALLAVVAIANDLAPLTEEDQLQHPLETDPEHRFRTLVWQPLHSLQSAVSIEKFATSDSATIEKVKKAVWLGSVAFEKVLTDPSASGFSSLQQTVDYFGGNSIAAAGRAERSKSTEV